MIGVEQHLLKVNGITLSVRVAGPEHGAPVWLLHGFPECWHSWQRQVEPLAAAGYRLFMPEMRGYGASDAPPRAEDYTLSTLCGDIQGAMDHFGHTRVCMIGHDWGAPVAWQLALLEPQRISALVTLSVPWAGRPKRPATQSMAQHFQGRFNYILYFQEPGVAEAELNADIQRSLRLFFREPGDDDPFLQDKPAGSDLFGERPAPPLPAWCSEADFAHYRTALARGFDGPLNWYRNFERNWQQAEVLDGRLVQQPTLFLVGEQDPVARLEAHTIARMPERVPRLQMQRLEHCGHWIQNEAAERVNNALLGFFAEHYPA